jgi:hypothetical protein
MAVPIGAAHGVHQLRHRRCRRPRSWGLYRGLRGVRNAYWLSLFLEREDAGLGLWRQPPSRISVMSPLPMLPGSGVRSSGTSESHHLQVARLAWISHTTFPRSIAIWRDFPARKSITRVCGTGRGARSWNFSGLRGQRRVCLGGPGADAVLSARGCACQAGEPRAVAAASRRSAAAPQTAAAGQPDAIAILMRRTLTRTSAPILSSLRRMVPQLALSKRV